MFASTAYVAVPRHRAGAYKQVQVSTGVDNASSHGLVAMLYDGLIDAIGEARGAIRSGDVALKGRAIGRAARIVDEGLNAPLDLEAGGAIASNLRDVYDYVMARLIHANIRSDEAALEECARLIEPLRSAWAGIADHAAATA